MIPSRIESDPEDPGLEVLHLAQPIRCSPAAQEHFLGDVLGIFGIAEQEPQGTDEFVPNLIEGLEQYLSCRRGFRSLGRRLSTDIRSRFFHTATL